MINWIEITILIAVLIILLQQIGFAISARRILAKSEEMANQIVAKQMADIWARREDFRAPLEEYILKSVNNITKTQGAGMPGVPMTGLQAGLAFLPRKYQGIAAIALQLMNKNKGGSEDEQSNPFK